MYIFMFSFCSKELLDALGIVANTLPPFIYRMRELGYPPGWLKEAETENSGLMLYDGKSKSFPKNLFHLLRICVQNGPGLI